METVPCVPDGGSITPLLQQHPSETLLCHIALAHSSCPYIHLHTQSYMTKYSPPSGSICTLHTLQAVWLVLLHLYCPTWAQMMGKILSPTSHLKHSVRWPRTSANVNDVLSASRHQSAKGAGGGGALFKEKTRGLPFSPRCSDVQYHYPSCLARLITRTKMSS